LVLAGCRGNRTEVASNAPPATAPAPVPAVPAAPVNNAAPPPPGPSTFAPYTVVQQLPPKPKHVVHRHHKLRVTRRDNQIYLADDSGRYYPAGRNARGEVYPVYTDPDTGGAIPLRYDRDRDRYYRVVRDDED